MLECLSAMLHGLTFQRHEKDSNHSIHLETKINADKVQNGNENDK